MYHLVCEFSLLPWASEHRSDHAFAHIYVYYCTYTHKHLCIHTCTCADGHIGTYKYRNESAHMKGATGPTGAYVSVYTYIHLIVCIYTYIYGCGAKLRVVAAPPLLQAFVAAGCFKPFVADAVTIKHITSKQCYYLKAVLCFFLGWFVAEGIVAEHPSLLQTYVAKWPLKPVTNPMFFIRSHIYIYTYTYRHMQT